MKNSESFTVLANGNVVGDVYFLSDDEIDRNKKEIAKKRQKMIDNAREYKRNNQ